MTNDILKAYKLFGSDDLRDRLVQRYMPLVRKTAGRIRSGSLASTILDMDDLFQLGVMGLIQALERFDQNKVSNFAVYAIKRIRGAILDGIRSQNIHSRGATRRNRVLDKISERHYVQTGTHASLQELVAASGFSTEQVERATRAVRHHAEKDYPEPYGLNHSVAALENKEFLAHALNHSGLSDRERLIIESRDLGDTTADELGKRLNISSSMVFRLRKAALDKIRNAVEASTS